MGKIYQPLDEEYKIIAARMFQRYYEWVQSIFNNCQEFKRDLTINPFISIREYIINDKVVYVVEEYRSLDSTKKPIQQWICVTSEEISSIDEYGKIEKVVQEILDKVSYGVGFHKSTYFEILDWKCKISSKSNIPVEKKIEITSDCHQYDYYCYETRVSVGKRTYDNEKRVKRESKNCESMVGITEDCYSILDVIRLALKLSDMEKNDKIILREYVDKLALLMDVNICKENALQLVRKKIK